MAVSEDAVRLLDEVAAAEDFDEVQSIVTRWRWRFAVSLDPELATTFEGDLQDDGTPVSHDQLRAWMGD